MNRKRMVICWTDISGYLAACLRALVRHDVDLLVLALARQGPETAFGGEAMEGIPCRLLTEAELEDTDLVASIVLQHRPDAICVPGWSIPSYRALVRHPALARARKVMTMDTPWKRSARKYIGSLLLRPYLQRFDCVVVAGERAWQYARRLGVSEARLRRGLYACDYDLFAQAQVKRLLAGEWPRKFLFAGRYVEDKGLDTLLEAYRQYRTQVPDPWPLTCCGKGPLASLLASVPGVRDFGFVQPQDLPTIMAEHGAFVLASRYEPWGVVVAEALAAALPVVCTESVGASVELVRPYFNGLTVATDEPAPLAAALRWIHMHHGALPEMGRRGRELAAAFSAEMWAQRWVDALAITP